MKKIIILGGIGNGSVIAWAIRDAAKKFGVEIEVAGFLNDRENYGNQIEGFPVLGKTTDWIKFDESYSFINTIYRLDGNRDRVKNFEALQIPSRRLYSFIHPTAYVAENVELGAGCVIMPNCSISSGAVLGMGCLVMVNATIGHNCKIADYCHFAAQCCLGSFITISRGVHIGLKASVRESVSIGEFAALGMGAVLLNDINQQEIWAGNPARYLRHAK